MFVEKVLPLARKNLVTIKDDAQLIEAAQLLADRHCNLVIVCGGNSRTMVGVISKADIVQRISQCQGSACTTSVASVMVSDVTYCGPVDLLRDVWSTMNKRGFFHVPVVDSDRQALGVLNAREALLALLVEAESEESLMREYITGVGYR